MHGIEVKGEADYQLDTALRLNDRLALLCPCPDQERYLYTETTVRKAIHSRVTERLTSPASNSHFLNPPFR
jgi:hypothetical protein